jgi:hypothetical protein
MALKRLKEEISKLQNNIEILNPMSRISLAIFATS